jgi:putative spermidine/putrescine transport system substrate-binding protein
VWKALRELDAAIQKDDDGNYPAHDDIIHSWFANEEVWLYLDYDVSHASSKILSGAYANTTDGYILDDGTISNVNFVAIPQNSNNKAAAMVAGNVLATLEAAFVRNQPERWGAFPAFDGNSEAIAASGWDTAFDYIERHHATPTVEQMVAGRLAELDPEYDERLKADWVTCVRDGGQSNPTLCGI